MVVVKIDDDDGGGDDGELAFGSYGGRRHRPVLDD